MTVYKTLSPNPVAPVEAVLSAVGSIEQTIKERKALLEPYVREYKRLELAERGLANIDQNWSPK